jgi:hypothetical protein
MTVKTNKPPKTPVLEMSSQPADDATDQLASGVPLADVAAAAQSAPEPVPTTTPVLADKDIPTGNPGVNHVDPPVVDQSPLVAHLTNQNLEFSTHLQAATLELALTKKDLEAAQVKATENAVLLSDLTKATCAAINTHNIQLGKAPVDPP